MMTDDEILRSEVWRFRQVLDAIRMDREDAMQEVYLSIAKRPLDGTTGAHRRINIRQRLIDILRLWGWRDRQPKYTGAKAAFRISQSWVREAEEVVVPPVETEPWLARRLATLDQQDQDVLRRHFWDDEPLSAIGRAYGFTTSGAWVAKERALAHLRQEMKVCA